MSTRSEGWDVIEEKSGEQEMGGVNEGAACRSG